MSREPVMTEWAGLPNYGCPFCPFSSIDLPQFETHMTTHPEDSRSLLLIARREQEKAARDAKVKSDPDVAPTDAKPSKKGNE